MRISNIYKVGRQPKKSKFERHSFLPQHSGVVVPKETTERLKEFIKENLSETPKSEIWFNKLYKDYRDENDFFNTPLGNYIPDVANYRFKYVIEVDGSIHDLEYVKRKDAIKNEYYKENGYRVIRIRAYSVDDFNKCLYILNIIRKKIIKRNVTFSQSEIDAYMCASISCPTTKAATHVTKGTGIV